MRKDALTRHKKRKYPCDGSKLRQKRSDSSAARMLNIPISTGSEYSVKKSKYDEALIPQHNEQKENSKIARPIVPTSGTHFTVAEKR